MKVKDQLGFKRLAIFLTVAAFLITYVCMLRTDNIPYRAGYLVLFNHILWFALVSAFVAGITYLFIIAVYWVIDGFRKED